MRRRRIAANGRAFRFGTADADRTVNPGNAGEIVKQWLNVHDLELAPLSSGDVDGHVREQWWDQDGQTVVESYTVRAMAHGIPLAIDGEPDSYGAAGPYMLDVGISSTVHIAAFFGLTERIVRQESPEAQQQTAHQPTIDLVPIPKAAGPHSAKTARPAVFDVGEVINRALGAAGLLK